MVNNPLKKVNGRYEMDFELLERQAAEPLPAEPLQYLKSKNRLPTGMERITEPEQDLAAQ